VRYTSSVHYSFGMPITERTHEQEAYRFGFNSQERDDNINGTGNINTAEFWSYDTRLGRRWNMDPIVKPWESVYATFGNNPILFADPYGLDKEITSPDGSKGNASDGITQSEDGCTIYNDPNRTTKGAEQDWDYMTWNSDLGYYEKSNLDPQQQAQWQDDVNYQSRYFKNLSQDMEKWNDDYIKNHSTSWWELSRDQARFGGEMNRLNNLNENYQRNETGNVDYGGRPLPSHGGALVNVDPTFEFILIFAPILRLVGMSELLSTRGVSVMPNLSKRFPGFEPLVTRIGGSASKSEIYPALQKIAKGDWIKVYQGGHINGKATEIHYFLHKSSGLIVNPKIKYSQKVQSVLKKLGY
jgi:hypothetical protein